MFGIGPLELVVILALALIVLGPTKFPEAGRAVGKAIREFRSITSDLTRDVSFDVNETPPRRYAPPSRTVEAESLEASNGSRPATETSEPKVEVVELKAKPTEGDPEKRSPE